MLTSPLLQHAEIAVPFGGDRGPVGEAGAVAGGVGRQHQGHVHQGYQGLSTNTSVLKSIHYEHLAHTGHTGCCNDTQQILVNTLRGENSGR